MAIDMSRSGQYGLGRLWRDIDQLFSEAMGTRSGDGAAGVQSLPVNVWETDDGYQAALLAPGLDEQSLNATVHQDTLAIEGELKFQAPEGAKMVWQEFGPARFRRSLRVGAAVDSERVEALYRNGLLLVTMPKADHARPRQVNVQFGAGASGQGTEKRLK
jgi:HSP20 family protein